MKSDEGKRESESELGTAADAEDCGIVDVELAVVADLDIRYASPAPGVVHDRTNLSTAGTFVPAPCELDSP